MAVVRKSTIGHEGTSVVVGKYVGKKWSYEDCWETEPELVWTDGGIYGFPEAWLMRIDGYTEEETKELVKEV